MRSLISLDLGSILVGGSGWWGENLRIGVLCILVALT